jgi:hypothetical protein
VTINIIDNKMGRGGLRNGSGRKKGSGENTKICVSVHEGNWNNAVKRWQRYRKQRKPSWLVDRLILHYLKHGDSILDAEAVI